MQGSHGRLPRRSDRQQRPVEAPLSRKRPAGSPCGFFFCRALAVAIYLSSDLPHAKGAKKKFDAGGAGSHNLFLIFD